MFGHEPIQMRGVATNVDKGIVVGGHSAGGVSGAPAQVHVRSKEILTFLLTNPENAAATPVELIGRRAYFRTLPVREADVVEVVGISKPRAGYIRALKVHNLTTGVTAEGRRFRTV
jgi:hypothetical protein